MNERGFFLLNPKWAVESIIVGMWLMVALVIFFQDKNNHPPSPLPTSLTLPSALNIEKDKFFDVKKIVVIRGDYFDLTLKEDDIHFFGKLSVITKEDAKIKVLELLNNTTKPKVVLREKQKNGCWIVDFFVLDKNKEINLVEWLSSNNLVYK